jgi:ureidoglycolate lyase
MPDQRTIRVDVEPMTAESFSPFGIVLEAPAQPPDFIGNRSHSWLYPFEAEGGTQLMFMRFYHQPMRFSVLERHLNVTQGFVPLGGTPCVMVVAPPTDNDDPRAYPEPQSVRAFAMDGTAGLLMHKGTWHTLDRFPLRPPHIDVLFLTAASTQAELIRQNADGTLPSLTQVVDYATHGVGFEVVGAGQPETNA